jgi:Zinc dependent phospholipase C
LNLENRIRTPLPQSTAFGKWSGWCARVVAVFLAMLLCTSGSFGYSVLTHEEVVDLVWTDELRPLLLKRFPTLTEDQLKEAHGYAYGGAVIQDLGYYPFGSVEFSNLVHYVRSGDFVRELLLQSQDPNEYAFALGALAHYASDIAGHPAVNQAVSIQYPKLRAKYGNSVRYAEDQTAHLKTEFGFDNNPTAQTEDLYFKSINTTVDQYRNYLEQVRADSLQLANYDFDTGKETKAAEYSLTDETYAKLLGQLAERKFELTSPDLRDNILKFYSDLSVPIETKKDNARWQSVLSSLDQLKLVTPAPIVAANPAN